MASLRPLRAVAKAFTTPLQPEDFLALVDPLASSRQLRGVVTSVTHETPTSATITFRPGRGWDPHLAGQYARVGVEIDGVRHWRSYSLSAGEGGDPAITVSAIGLVSEALVRRTRVGDVLFLAPPQGDFVLPEHPRPLLMITAGSGITPVMSMIRTLASRRDDADVVLLHSARTRDDVIFADELAELHERLPGLRVVLRITSEQRRVDLTTPADLDAACPDWRERHAYVCGPAEMLDAATELFRAQGLDSLSVERFAVDLLPGAGGSGGLVTFETSDKEVEVDGSTTLLEAAEGAGIVAPSGCRMGICHSCLTPLVAGQVRDLRTGEIHGEPGDLVQTCVSAAAGPCNLEL